MLDRSLKIRNYHETDLEILYEIDQRCFPEGIAFSRDDLIFYLNRSGSIVRVAEVSGIVEGFLLAGIEDSQLAHIITLDVNSGQRRQGVGFELMEDAHDTLKRHKITASLLEVGINNLPARRLYERLQYRYFEILPGYYAAGGHNRGDPKVRSSGEGDAYRMVRLF